MVEVGIGLVASGGILSGFSLVILVSPPSWMGGGPWGLVVLSLVVNGRVWLVRAVFGCWLSLVVLVGVNMYIFNFNLFTLSLSSWLVWV